MGQYLTGGELVVRLLASLGPRHVFGVPGGQTLAITDAILDHPGIDFVTARHEGAAAVMADAYGRITSTPGVCLATTGPGATNLLTGVGGALRDSSPVLVIMCNNNKDDAQNADHVGIFTPLTKRSRLVAHPMTLVQAVEEAYIEAMTGNPGPAHLDFARDAIEAVVGEAPELAIEHPLRSWVRQRPRPEEAAMSVVVAYIAAARRPVLWLGNGCARSGAGRAAVALAEQENIPIVTTFNGIGIVETTHPLVFGSLSRMGTSLSTRVMADADLVIAVGNSLNAVSTSRWALNLPDIVHIAVEPTTIGRYYAARTHGVLGDARQSLEQVARLLAAEAGRRTATARRDNWLAELSRLRDSWWDSTRVVDGEATGDGLPPAEVVRRLREAAPDDTLLIPDAGNPGVWSYLWEIRRPGTCLKPVGFGNMGFALPAGIAAAILGPKWPVLLLIGDGSLGMTLAELETLARVGGCVCVVVLNDAVREHPPGAGREVRAVHHRCRLWTGQLRLGRPRARYQGAARERPRTARQAGQEALAADEPALFDVAIDPDIRAWTFPAFQATRPKKGDVNVGSHRNPKARTPDMRSSHGRAAPSRSLGGLSHPGSQSLHRGPAVLPDPG